MALESIFSNNEFPKSSSIISGDFNVNLMPDRGDVNRFLDVMRSYHYLQTVLSITRPASSTLIDHVWINELCGYNCGVVKTGITDHHAVFIVLPFRSDKKSSQVIKINFRDHSENYMQSFETLLINFDWRSLYSDDVNLYMQNFVHALNDMYRKSFPLRTKLVTYKFFKNPWYSNEVKKLSEARNTYHKLL